MRQFGSRRTLAFAGPAIIGLAFGLLVVAYLAVRSLAPFSVAGPPARSPEAAFRARLDQAVPNILKRYGVPGMAIGTVIHGDPGEVYVYGLADVEQHRPVTPDTVFQVASISKSVSAWGVLTLVDAGKVDLDHPAIDYLPGWPLPPSRFNPRAITVRNLLTHTAGLNGGDDEFRRPDQPSASPTELLSREGPLVRGKAGPARLVAPAGAAFNYSVPGYTLVQMLIENEAREPFKTYMRDSVLRPLGMDSSSYDWDPPLRPRTATPYLDDGSASSVRVPQDQAADSLFSTAGDMARFLAAPLPGLILPEGAGVLKPVSVHQLFLRPEKSPKQNLLVVGPDAPCMGCFIERSDGGPVIVTNFGKDPGWTAQVHTVPATGDALVILTNSSRAQPAIAQVAGIWAAWRGLPAPQLTRSYRTLGRYAIAIVGLISVFAIGGAASLAIGVVAGRRRFGAFHLLATAQSAVECTLAGGLCILWFMLRSVFDLLPTFAMVTQGAVIGLCLTAVARALVPKLSP